MSCIDNKCVFIQFIQIWVAWDSSTKKMHSDAVTFHLECDSSLDVILRRIEKERVLYLPRVWKS
jgi:hypothetical protein